MGKKRKTGPKTTWTTEKGNSIVGKVITVTWPSDNVYYNALVLEFLPRLNQHKILYLADESLECLELGHGPGQREYHDATQPEDHLIGKDVVLNDRELGENHEEWFHFMRPSYENIGDRFAVTVVAALAIGDVDFEEVSGPRKADGDHRYYRVIYLPNEYLATIDLAATDYNVVKKEIPMDEEEQQQAPEEPPAEALDQVPEEAPEEEQPEKKEDDEAYVPPENIDIADDESDTPTLEPVRVASPDRVRERDRHRQRGDRKAVDADPTQGLATDDHDIDIAKATEAYKLREVGEDDEHEALTDVHVTADDAMDALEMEQGDTGGRAMGEGSIGTQETRDDSLDPGKSEKKRPPPPRPSSLFPKTFEDEEGNITASDDGKNGWEGKRDENGTTSKVGDYIQLHTGMGVPRKAFVEAYLPQTGTHFVAFCDARGGNLQIKLTKDNHTVLDDEEVDVLNRAKKEESPEAITLPDDDDIPKEEIPKKRKRRARSPTKTKGRKRAQRAPEIKGRAADEKICGRCISIVWPVETLVYVALVLGYSSHSKEHQIVYMVDHCVETLDLRYREWSLLPREKEPWISTGMVGKRLYVFWDGSYDDDESQAIARDKFGDKTRVPYEAYVLTYIGDGKYKIIYTATEDTETRELRVDEEDKDVSAIDKEWDLLEDGAKSVDGLPLIGWTD